MFEPSKCVCKPWLDFLSTDEFVKLHLSRSAAALAVWSVKYDYERPSWCTVFELEYQIDDKGSHEDHYNLPIKLNFPANVAIEGCASGLLFLRPYDQNGRYVCNPITREYIKLGFPREFLIGGFGVSKISGQYKVVWIKQSKSDCRVYTLGTGSWRRIEAPGASFSYYASSATGAFVNGNLHWVVLDSNGSLLTSCFDLETECFTTFSVPPVEVAMRLSVLRDCLCVYYPTSQDDLVLWLMKEYGNDKSWTKEYVINLTPPDFSRYRYSRICPIHVFEDGDVLMLSDARFFFYYSNKTKTAQKTGVFDVGDNDFVTSMLLTPSFLSLKSFTKENVISL